MLRRFLPTIAVFLTVAAAAQAQNFTWLAAGGGLFNTAANWTPAGGPPGAGDGAQFDLTNTYTVTFTSGTSNNIFGIQDGNVTFALSGQTYTLTSGTSVVGSVAGQTGRLTLSNGTVSIGGTGLQVGSPIGSTGFLTVGANTNLNVTSANGIQVGASGTGTLTVQGGGAVSTTIFTVANGSSSFGTATVTGAGSSLTASGNFNVGSVGFGTMAISSGAVVTANNTATIGGSVNSTGSLTVTGGGTQFNATNGQLQVAGSGQGTMTVSNGATVTTTAIATNIGNSGGGNGLVTVTGNNTTWNGASFILGNGSNSSSQLDVLAGGHLTSTGISLGNNTNVNATMNVDGVGTQAIVSGSLTIASSGTGTSQLDVSGGSFLQATNVILGAGVGTLGLATIQGVGTVVNTGALRLGQSGFGSLGVLSGATVNATGAVTIGENAAGGGGLGMQGTLNAGAGFFIGGTSSVAGNNAVVFLNPGSVVNVTGETKIWNNSLLSIEGGTLNTNNFTRSGGNLVFNDGTLKVSSGTFNSNPAGPNNFQVAGSSAGALPTLKLDASFAGNITDLFVGNTGTNTAGAIEVSNGSFLQTTGSALINGSGSGAGSSMTISGNFSAWGAGTGNVVIGSNLRGTLNISNSAQLFGTGNHTLGQSPGGNGTANIDGGFWFPNTLTVGAGGVGTLNVTNGGQVFSSGAVEIGSGANSSGTVSVTGTNSLLSTTSTLRVGNAGNGTLRVSNGGVVSSGGLQQIGGTSFGTAEIQPGGNWFANSGFTVNPNGVLRMTGGTFQVTNLTLSVPNDLQFSDGVINLFGTFSNGTTPNNLNISGFPAATASPTLTVQSGGGTTNVSNAFIGNGSRGSLVINGGSFAANNDIFVGASTGSQGTITVNNGALIAAGNLFIGSFVGGVGHVTLNSGFANINLLGVDAGSTLTINNNAALFLNDLSFVAAPIAFNSGSIVFNGAVTLESYRVNALLGPTSTLSANRFVQAGGTLTLSAPLTVDDGGGLFGSSSLVNNSTLQLQGGLASSSATLTNNAGKTIVVSGTGQLAATNGITNAGILQLNNNLVPTSGGTLTNTGIVRGSGQVGNTLSNSTNGQVNVTTGQLLQFTSTGNHSNAGVMSLVGGELQMAGPITNVAGTGLISGRDGIMRFNGGVTNNGSMAFSNGTMDVFGNITSTRFASSSDRSMITVTGGGVANFYGDVTVLAERTNVQVSAAGGTVSKVVFFGSYNGGIFGTGTAFIEGDLRPGASPALVTFGGDLVYGSGARLQMELGGTNRGSQYDSTDVLGGLFLSGTLDVDLINGFTPSAGQTFTVATFNTRSGDFTTYQDLNVSPGLALVPSFTSHSLILTATAVPEPATLALTGVIGGLAGIRWLRRRRSKS